jgi:hypothetical protein
MPTPDDFACCTNGEHQIATRHRREDCGTAPAAELPEDRVNAYLAAVAEENRRAYPIEDVAWAVPDDGGLVTLTLSDLRDAMAELAALRSEVRA